MKRDFDDSDFEVDWLEPKREPGRRGRAAWALVGLVAAPALVAVLTHFVRHAWT